MSTSTRILVSALFLMGLSGIANAALPPVIQGKYAPKDECAKVPGASEFRATLADAVRRRDADALVALADPAIELDYGGGAGDAELRQRLTGADGTELWGELDALLPLGCAVEKGEMVLPWFFVQDLLGDDIYSLMLVTGERIPLLPKADAEARPVRLLSWTLVMAEEGFDERARLQRVRTEDGTVGFVAADKLRSTIGYRLIASRQGGAWKITALIAGD